MFIDASALCAILAREPDAKGLTARLLGHDRRLTSATAIWETAIALSRITKREPNASRRLIHDFLRRYSIDIVPIPPEAAALAVDAFARYGKGRHPAALNFGDCFAYACARRYAVPLLYKGDDFAATDIEPA